jgi:hypothetical protein
MIDNGYLLCFRMVGATRGTPEGFRADQASGSQQPPSPPPNLAEVMMGQIELLNLLVQAQQNQQRQQSRGGRDDPHTQVANYQDFLSTQPPLFHKADEPLDANTWLRTIESKFALLSTPCSEENKALFAAQQLRGTARIWWDHFHAMQPAGHVITWDEFRTAFRAHDIPEGLIERKLNEFLNLTQGTCTVLQYAQVFNHLCQYAEIYLDQIVRLHGIPKTIISNRGAQFVARFWEQLQHTLGTKLIRSSAYHFQTDGQTERINHILEDMLRACVLQYDKNWDKCLSLAEFSYNNSYQASIKMAPFEALYDRQCRTRLSWSQTGERKIFGPDLVTEAEEKVKTIQSNLKTAQARQKSYADL